MQAHLFTLRHLELALLLAGLAAVCGCPPDTPRTAGQKDTQAPGTYLAAPNKLFDNDAKFDIRWEVIHEQPANKFDPSTNVSGRDLALGRCTRCHECGFSRAFDLQHYNTLEWKPVYKGQEWGASIRRMIPKEDSLLDEAVGARIYTFLRDETQGLYDESKDTKGAIVVEVDDPPASN